MVSIVRIEQKGDNKMKRTDTYTGPFPRKRHSHRCKGCEKRGQYNAVACYKSQCCKPQLSETCSWCAEPNYSAYEVVSSMTGQVVSGRLPNKQAAEEFTKERSYTMGKSMNAYHIRGIR